MFTDNCGEIVFDKILCRELKVFNPGLYVSVVVKGEPILSDATLQDAERLVCLRWWIGCLRLVFCGRGGFFQLLRGEGCLEKADLIIAKGMGEL